MKTKTLLIVGAGASSEYGLPLGSKLLTDIRGTLESYFANPRKDIHFLDGMARLSKIHGVEQRIIDSAARDMTDAIPLARSIDELIDHRGDNPYIAKVAKLAITREILKAERESSIVLRPRDATNIVRLPFENVGETWIPKLFGIMNATFSGYHSEIFENTAVINFNYDRCIEHFLLHAMMAYYSLDEERAASYVRALDIVHPYGQVGRLPWQEMPDLSAAPYGADAPDLPEISTGIRTFTEQFEDGHPMVARMRKMVTEAERIIILGFSFHEMNMRLLSGGQLATDDVYATAEGISEGNMPVIRERLNGLVMRNPLEPKLFPGKASPMLSSFNLTFGAEKQKTWMENDVDRREGRGMPPVSDGYWMAEDPPVPRYISVI